MVVMDESSIERKETSGARGRCVLEGHTHDRKNACVIGLFAAGAERFILHMLDLQKTAHILTRIPWSCLTNMEMD